MEIRILNLTCCDILCSGLCSTRTQKQPNWTELDILDTDTVDPDMLVNFNPNYRSNYIFQLVVDAFKNMFSNFA